MPAYTRSHLDTDPTVQGPLGPSLVGVSHLLSARTLPVPRGPWRPSHGRAGLAPRAVRLCRHSTSAAIAQHLKTRGKRLQLMREQWHGRIPAKPRLCGVTCEAACARTPRRHARPRGSTQGLRHLLTASLPQRLLPGGSPPVQVTLYLTSRSHPELVRKVLLCPRMGS